MTTEEISNTWDLEKVSNQLRTAYTNNSEIELLSIIKQNSFLLHDLYSRKFGIQPAFHEISFGGDMRCDFAWLNDNSDGPEWVLLEVEKPDMDLFTKSNDPTSNLYHAIEQIASWRRYFNENSGEKRRIFGAVKNFRFIIAGGTSEKWGTPQARKWRIDYNNENNIEIRSSSVFLRPLRILSEHPETLWSFAEHPTTLSHSKLKPYLDEYKYMQGWQALL